jgi:hypothetical protein
MYFPPPAGAQGLFVRAVICLRREDTINRTANPEYLPLKKGSGQDYDLLVFSTASSWDILLK